MIPVKGSLDPKGATTHRLGTAGVAGQLQASLAALGEDRWVSGWGGSMTRSPEALRIVEMGGKSCMRESDAG